MLDRACRCLHGGWSERRLAVGREDHPVDASRFCAPEERPDVLWILERVEREDEWRLAALRRAGEDVVDAGPGPRIDDEGDPLVSIEPGDRGEGSALDLDDRDPEARRVQDEPLERRPALWHDQESTRAAARDECLLDRTPPGNELLTLRKKVGGGNLGRCRERLAAIEWAWSGNRIPCGAGSARSAPLARGPGVERRTVVARATVRERRAVVSPWAIPERRTVVSRWAIPERRTVVSPRPIPERSASCLARPREWPEAFRAVEGSVLPPWTAPRTFFGGLSGSLRWSPLERSRPERP